MAVFRVARINDYTVMSNFHLYIDAHTWQPFRRDYTAQQLEQRFALEEERAARGLPNKGRAFYAALHKRLEECP